MTPVNSVFSIWEGMHEANGAGYRQGARLLAWASQPTPAPQCGVVDSSSCGAADGATRITPCTKTKPMSCSTNPGMQHACTTHDPHAPKPHTTTAQAGREDKAERIQAGHWPTSDRMGKRHLPHGPRGADGPAVCARPPGLCCGTRARMRREGRQRVSRRCSEQQYTLLSALPWPPKGTCLNRAQRNNPPERPQGRNPHEPCANFQIGAQNPRPLPPPSWLSSTPASPLPRLRRPRFKA